MRRDLTLGNVLQERHVTANIHACMRESHVSYLKVGLVMRYARRAHPYSIPSLEGAHDPHVCAARMRATHARPRGGRMRTTHTRSHGGSRTARVRATHARSREGSHTARLCLCRTGTRKAPVPDAPPCSRVGSGRQAHNAGDWIEGCEGTAGGQAQSGSDPRTAEPGEDAAAEPSTGEVAEPSAAAGSEC